MLRFSLLLAGALLAGPAVADPFVYTVGADGPSQCSTTSIQAAVDMARAHPGPDIIHIANNLSYSGQDIEITSGGEVESLQIVGGYTSCEASNNFEWPPSRTTLSGAGGDDAPVIWIKNGAAVDVELYKLNITRGDNGFGNGGGASFVGRGYLTLRETNVLSNFARHGGGLYFEAKGGTAILQLKADTVISGNVALADGGGVHVAGTNGHKAVLWATEPRVTIKDNRADDGRGGGLFAHAFTDVELTSPGFGTPSTAILANNHARDGGGLALKADSWSNANESTSVSLHSDSASGYVQLHGNTASERGGAILIQGDYESVDEATAHLQVRDFLVTENSAPDGAVAFIAAGGGYNTMVMASGTCRHYPCNRLERNSATGANGALIRVRERGDLVMNRPVFAWNNAAHLARLDGFHHFERNKGLTLGNCVVVLNTFGGSTFQVDGEDSTLRVVDCTIADNLSGYVFEFENASDRLQLHNSILSEAAPPLFTRVLGTSVETSNNIVHAAAAIGPYDQTSVVAPAHFLDRTVGDYRLKPGSRAVDFAANGSNAPQDLAFNDRGMDFALKLDGGGPRDVGALEFLPTTYELVMNNELAGDLRAWEPVAVGDLPSTIDRDPVGLGIGGALRATLPAEAPAGDIVVARQCIPLPLSGDFVLTGVADAGPADTAPDRAAVRLLLRKDSSECSPLAAVIGTTEASVTAGQWRTFGPVGFNVGVPVLPNYTVSVEMQLIVRRNPARVGSNASVVRFDGLSLTPGTVVGGPLFGDSFED